MMEEKWGNQTMPFKSHYYQLDQLYRWVEDQQRKSSVVWNTAPKVTKFCEIQQGQGLPYDTKLCDGKGKIEDRRVIFIWSFNSRVRPAECVCSTVATDALVLMQQAISIHCADYISLKWENTKIFHL